ncbi:Rid family hydrolase [Parapedobacter lycopersici]|uniref:RidA family protein n=1 Tax=Parapedobacter lycopersici TaxID=1864939 RepID=UPI003341CDBA
MKKKEKIIHPERTSVNDRIWPFSDAVTVDGWLYISGQGPVDFSTGAFLLGSIEDETHRTLHNISCLVQAAGGTMEDIVKCNVYLADINDWQKFSDVYTTYFPSTKPARTTVQSGLGFGIKIEIDAVAKIPTT